MRNKEEEKLIKQHVINMIAKTHSEGKINVILDAYSRLEGTMKAYNVLIHSLMQFDEPSNRVSLPTDGPPQIDYVDHLKKYRDDLETLHLVTELVSAKFFRSIASEVEYESRMDDYKVIMPYSGSEVEINGIDKYGEESDDADLEIVMDAFDKLVSARKIILANHQDYEFPMIDKFIDEIFDDYEHELIALYCIVGAARAAMNVGIDIGGEVLLEIIEKMDDASDLESLLKAIASLLVNKIPNYKSHDIDEFGTHLCVDHTKFIATSPKDLLLEIGKNSVTRLMSIIADPNKLDQALMLGKSKEDLAELVDKLRKEIRDNDGDE